MTTSPPDAPMPANNPTEPEVRRLIALLNDPDASLEDRLAAATRLIEIGYGPGTPPVRTDGAYRKG